MALASALMASCMTLSREPLDQSMSGKELYHTNMIFLFLTITALTRTVT